MDVNVLSSKMKFYFTLQEYYRAPYYKILPSEYKLDKQFFEKSFKVEQQIAEIPVALFCF